MYGVQRLMIERGIWTTKADIWAHLHPHDAAIYWYAVKHMREHLNINPVVAIPGKSKDGSVTGSGYLVPKDSPFIRHDKIPSNIISAFDWDSGTDRQTGMLWGEKVVDWVITLGIWRPPVWITRRCNKKSEQFEMGDLSLEFVHMPFIEVKTELVKSPDLFIQNKELYHNVHLKKGRGGVLLKEYTKATTLLSD
jgi:hypothetical protein